MKRKYLYLLFALLSLTVSKASAVQLTWTDEKGVKIARPILFVERVSNNYPMIFIKVAGPVPVFTTATFKSGDADVKLDSVNAKNISFLFLTSAHGQVEFQTATGTQKYSYDLDKSPSQILLSKSCKQDGLRAQLTKTTFQTQYPALLACKFDKGALQQLIFSSTEDAQWFAGEIFETEGKGERYKVFDGHDIRAAKQFSVSWGEPTAKNKAYIIQPTKSPDSKKTESAQSQVKSAISFSVGVQYLTGSVQSGALSANIAGMEIPLEVQYRKQNSNWFLGAHYDFFAYAMSATNSITDFTLSGGYAMTGKNLELLVRIGYNSVEINAVSIQTTADLEAPQFGLDLSYGHQKKFGVVFNYAKALGQGSLSELVAGAYYQFPVFSAQTLRINVNHESFTAEANAISLQESSTTVGLSFLF